MITFGWVHEYWNCRIAIVVALGLGAFGAWLSGHLPRPWITGALVILLLASVTVPLYRLGTELWAVQYVDSSDAGALTARNEVADYQSIAWHHGGISGPRWYSWYTNLPVRQFDPDDTPHPDALVLVKRARDNELCEIDWVDWIGHYAFVRASDLEAAIEDSNQYCARITP